MYLTEKDKNAYDFETISIKKNDENNQIELTFNDDQFWIETYIVIQIFKKKFKKNIESIFITGEEERCVWKERIDENIIEKKYKEFVQIMTDKQSELSFESSSDFKSRRVKGLEIRFKREIGSKWKPTTKVVNEIKKNEIKELL